MAKKLAKHLDLHTLGDLLRHYPRRHVARGEPTRLAELEVGAEVTVQAQVKAARSRPMRARAGTIWEIVVTDGADELRLTFFAKKAYSPAKRLTPGTQGLFSGTVSRYREDLQLTHPAFIVVGEADQVDDSATDQDVLAFTDELIPIYPATSAVKSWELQREIRKALAQIDDLPDPLPAAVRARHGLIGLGAALRLIHRARDLGEAEQAKNRLRWDEAFVLQVALAQRRAAARALAATPRPTRGDGLLAAFDARLPFQLTNGQQEIGRVLQDELARAYPMHRLLQGEVGSGKTVVALRAMLTVIDSGGQAALLAPTEVLAQQHHRSLTDLLGSLGAGGRLDGEPGATRVALLTGSGGTAGRRRAMLEAACGDAGIVVGTHALLEERVDFADLGLVVVDEQHRFGVEQRDALRAKGERPPHLLVMTATPIPRTVAMTVFGDLDVSTLTELPRGRAGVDTHLVPIGDPRYLDRTWARVREEVAAGHQAFVVCPRIGDGTDPPEDPAIGGEPHEDGDGDRRDGDSPRRPAAAVLDIAPMLAAGPLEGLRLAALHGRMTGEAKDAVMARFAAGDLDVLVATTVIEVGVDVPNATAMVVMDGDRFGISQLHQLRGRIGRGGAAGVCLLLTDAPPDSPGHERLCAVAATTDGFALARLDLQARREGDVLGAAQSGRRSSLRMLKVIRDADVIAAARVEAAALVEADPTLAAHPELAAALADFLDPERAAYLERT